MQLLYTQNIINEYILNGEWPVLVRSWVVVFLITHFITDCVQTHWFRLCQRTRPQQCVYILRGHPAVPGTWALPQQEVHLHRGLLESGSRHTWDCHGRQAIPAQHDSCGMVSGICLDHGKHHIGCTSAWVITKMLMHWEDPLGFISDKGEMLWLLVIGMKDLIHFHHLQDEKSANEAIQPRLRVRRAEWGGAVFSPHVPRVTHFITIQVITNLPSLYWCNY